VSVASGLRLEASLPQARTDRSEPFPVEVRLRNVAEAPLVVNRRLEVGYRDSLSRELFVDILTEDGEPAPTAELDYTRQWPSRSDYGELGPGEELDASFDLFRWYRPLEPGRYRIIVHYQADEPAASPPENVVRGVVSSAVRELEVKG
jgi:hypothetical protein